MIITVESGVMDTGCQVLNQPRSDFQQVGDTLYLCGSRFALTSAQGEICPGPCLCQEGLSQASCSAPQPHDREDPAGPHLLATPSLQELSLGTIEALHLAPSCQKVSFSSSAGRKQWSSVPNMVPDGLSSGPASPLTISESLYNLRSPHLLMHAVGKLIILHLVPG